MIESLRSLLSCVNMGIENPERIDPIQIFVQCIEKATKQLLRVLLLIASKSGLEFADHLFQVARAKHTNVAIPDKSDHILTNPAKLSENSTSNL